MRVPKVRSIFIGLCAKGPNSLWLCHILNCPGFAMLSCACSFAVMLFSTWCWLCWEHRHVFGDDITLFQYRLLSLSSLPLATPVEHCAHSKFPSGLAIRVLISWFRNSASPISPGLASANFFCPPTTPFLLFHFALIHTNSLLICKKEALLSLRLIYKTWGICCCVPAK